MSAEPLSEGRITELRESVGVGFGDERDELFFELDRARSAESTLLSRVAELEGELRRGVKQSNEAQRANNRLAQEREYLRLAFEASEQRLAAIVGALPRCNWCETVDINAPEPPRCGAVATRCTYSLSQHRRCDAHAYQSSDLKEYPWAPFARSAISAPTLESEKR